MNTKEYILEHTGKPSKYGPYSFSRMSNCGFKFKKTYIEEDRGLKLGRFGTAVGSAIHELAEIDIETRVRKPPEQWPKVSEMVDNYLDSHPEYLSYIDELTKQMFDFRMNFNISPEFYIGSEEELATGLDMSWMHYDDPNAWFRGKTDFLEIADCVARVTDFKNYPRIHTDAELQNISYGVGCQAMGYIAMVMAAYPHVHSAFFEIYYTRFGCSRESHYYDENDKYRRRYYTRAEVAEWWKMNQRKMLSYERRVDWDANPSQSECQYCAHVHQCPFSIDNPEEFLAKTDEEARDMLKRLIVLKELTERIKKSLTDFVDNGSIKLDNGVEYGYEEYEQRSVDIKTLLKIARDHSIDMSPYVTITDAKFGSLIKMVSEKQELREQLEDVVSYTKKTRKRQI